MVSRSTLLRPMITLTSWYILVVLKQGPSHGYQIVKNIAEVSRGTVRVGTGNIYTTFQNLARKKLVKRGRLKGKGSTARRLYEITPKGLEYLDRQADTLKVMLAAYNKS